MSLLEWLANEYRRFGCALEFVTNKSQEGSQFCTGMSDGPPRSLNQHARTFEKLVSRTKFEYEDEHGKYTTLRPGFFCKKIGPDVLLFPLRTVAVRQETSTAWRGVRCSGVGVGGDAWKQRAVPNSNYVVPMDDKFSSSSITRPLIEILRDLNKKIPDNIVKSHGPGSNAASSGFIPWYHANRMLSFYAPGWCGEVRDVIYSENGSVTVVYRLTIRGSDGEAHRESTGTVTMTDNRIDDPVAAAEELAFCRACDGDLKDDSVVSAPLVDETATTLSESLGDEGKQRPFHRWLSSTRENADLSLYWWLSETGNNGLACGLIKRHEPGIRSRKCRYRLWRIMRRERQDGDETVWRFTGLWSQSQKKEFTGPWSLLMGLWSLVTGVKQKTEFTGLWNLVSVVFGVLVFEC
ncbi:hypothetical protein F2Q70_00000264 [Brassica cretica]|uniref:Uncharacterized protein n=1 Tax=Brassica cretica TaxID=69181 RepID=A0A8S9IK21_BRACR|nr:hypothetical protein F2Q70_00000264 [Brassica cretica]